MFITSNYKCLNAPVQGGTERNKCSGELGVATSCHIFFHVVSAKHT